jgi:hypothetical protein
VAVGAGVYVSNLAEVRKYLRKIHPDLVPVLREDLKAAIIVNTLPAIMQRVPKISGRAQFTLKARAGGNTLYVVAGGKSSFAPYFGWLDFGGTLRNRGPGRNQTIVRPIVKYGRYVYPGIRQTQDRLVEAAGRAVDKAVQSALR